MGRLTGIARRDRSRAPMQTLDRAEISTATGVAQDFRGKPGRRQVTVISAEAWRQAGIDAEDMVVPGTNHFTIVDQVTDAGSPLFRSICNLVRDGPV